jgi:hypothetical protein
VEKKVSMVGYVAWMKDEIHKEMWSLEDPTQATV